MPFAPAIAIELSSPAPKGRPAITASVTQKSGESAIQSLSAVFPVGFEYNDAFMPPRCDMVQEADKACPDGSKVGSLSGTSALASAAGDVYITSDFRLVSFVTAAGGAVRFNVVGNISVDPSGAFAVTFSGMPNLALTSLQLKLDGDALALVKNPATCGDFRFSVKFTSYDGDETTADPSVPITGCTATTARVALSALHVAPSRPAAGKPLTLRWRVTAATESTRVVLLRAGKRVRSRSVTGSSLRLKGLRAGHYVARLTASGAGRTAPAKRLSFTVAR